MDIPSSLRRRDGSSGGLGLGWLLAIALCGGILLFAAVGYLLVWRLKMRKTPCTTRVYAAGGEGVVEDDQHHPGVGALESSSTNVLSKKRFMRSDSSMSRLSTQLTMSNTVIWQPPVLPPLAPQGGSFLGMGRGRSRTWVDDGEEEHGPRVQRRSWRESWLRRDSWLAMMMLGAPTLPDVSGEAEKGEVFEKETALGALKTKEEGARGRVQVQKRRQSRPSLRMSQTAPELSTRNNEGSDDEEPPRGRSRETPRSSPTKGGSPTKTPRSCRTGSSTKTAGRMTPSPSKRNVQAGTPTKGHSRNASVSSIGSAANSLIRVATEQLELPAGPPSPRRLRGDARRTLLPKQLQLQVQPQQQRQQQQRRRSRSLDSDVSSCLSTLYSVGEAEEEQRGKTLAVHENDDPFVEFRRLHQQQGFTKKPSLETRQQVVNGPRPLRRVKTVEGMSVNSPVDRSAIPAPLRTISVNSHLGRAGRQAGEKRNSAKYTMVLQPPNNKMSSDDVKPKTSAPEVTKRASLTAAASETSIVSDSVYTDVSVGDTSEDTIVTEELPAHKRAASSVSSVATTPKKTGQSWDLSSSPLDEREVLSMFMESARSRRDLPVPPSRITLNDETILTTPLSPAPKSKLTHPVHSRRASIVSVSSSNYDQDSVSTPPTADETGQATELPAPRVTTSVASRDAAHSVGNTVGELRRMDSIVSSYSVASVASLSGGTLSESPTLPSLRGGGFAPDSKSEAVGKRNYLKLGGASQSKRNGSSSGQRQEQQQSSSSSHNGRNPGRSSIPVRSDKDKKGGGKENQGTNARTVRFDVPSGSGLREGRHGANLAPPSSPRGTARNTGEMTAAQLQRASVDSLGLYDQDGFLKNSPDGDAVARGGRLRM
ncbi:hypothetical protein ACRE_026390 [Hapsidospora chrysogenum ATCC 11550]|uniref:Uncharacterized protein n=1 Tax=Hapsidospora chrysogenum (strain ATCC 11550 / CBS 779.69 / DSM 880 / IAM 14645 / JCM 23072 / IMI 49137) TaxID=857340 RepID=A0A086TB56_HAPC1|nr:hypothetical protein ACRE_026390 [Hapsidospora chrysogenum ATCC 11550]